MTSFDNFYRLRPGGLDCDARGLTLGGRALLKQVGPPTSRQLWAPASIAEIQRVFMVVYGSSSGVDERAKGLRAVASALNSGDVALAQTAAVLLKLPDPKGAAAKVETHISPGVSKDWDPEAHPRSGGPPNAGWYAPRDGEENSGGDQGRSDRVALESTGSGGQESGGRNQQLAFAEPHDLIGIQNLGGITICIYQGRFLGGYYQDTSTTGICDPTVWVTGNSSN